MNLCILGLDPLIPLNRPLDRPPVGAQERPKVTFNDRYVFHLNHECALINFI